MPENNIAMKTYKYILLFLITVIVFPLSLTAQGWGMRKYEFYYGAGATNFMGDVGARKTGNVWIYPFNTIGPVINSGLRYNINKRHFVNGCLALGQLYAEDTKNNDNYWGARGLKFNTFMVEFTARYEFLIVNERSKRNVYRQLGETVLKNINIPTYLFIGVGAMFNIGVFSSLPSGAEEATVTKFNNFAPVLPVGIGFKHRVNKVTMVNLEVGVRLPVSDGIDYAKGSESPQYGKWIDQYQFVTFNVIHKLRSNRNGTPCFKRRCVL